MTTFLVILAGLFFGLVVALVMVWPSMIMFGVVHSYWAFVPAFGFWETLGVLVLARLILPTATVNN